MAAASGYHCGKCGQKTDSAGVVHTDNKGATSSPGHGNLPVADNWPEVRKP